MYGFGFAPEVYSGNIAFWGGFARFTLNTEPEPLRIVYDSFPVLDLVSFSAKGQ